MDHYWTRQDATALHKAETYHDLARIGLRIVRRMPYPVEQVCGPISTGGAGSMEENLKVFRHAIAMLKAKGRNVFDQMPFEEPMIRIRRSPYDRGYFHLLEEFYLPLFETGRFKVFHFIPGWQTSTGAQWEHTVAQLHDIEVYYL